MLSPVPPERELTTEQVKAELKRTKNVRLPLNGSTPAPPDVNLCDSTELSLEAVRAACKSAGLAATENARKASQITSGDGATFRTSRWKNPPK